MPGSSDSLRLVPLHLSITLLILGFSSWSFNLFLHAISLLNAFLFRVVLRWGHYLRVVFRCLILWIEFSCFCIEWCINLSCCCPQVVLLLTGTVSIQRRGIMSVFMSSCSQSCLVFVVFLCLVRFIGLWLFNLVGAWQEKVLVQHTCSACSF